mgnify:CR=1 FL=1
MPEYVPDKQGDVALKRRQEVKTPRRYRVFLHNDNYTTMDFVVFILEEIYRKSHDEAVRIMLNVHQNGMGLAGVYVKGIAETKITQTHKHARENGFPLKCSMEPE